MNATAALLDTLLPGDGDFPPASATGLVARLAAHDRFGPTLAPVLGALPEGFAALPPAARAAAAAAVEAARPAAFAALVTGVYALYYTDPAVTAVLARLTGAPAGPPQPAGHELPPFDPAMVAVPAARPPLFRPTPEDSP